MKGRPPFTEFKEILKKSEKTLEFVSSSFQLAVVPKFLGCRDRSFSPFKINKKTNAAELVMIHTHTLIFSHNITELRGTDY